MTVHLRSVAGIHSGCAPLALGSRSGSHSVCPVRRCLSSDHVPHAQIRQGLFMFEFALLQITYIDGRCSAFAVPVIIHRAMGFSNLRG